MLDVRCGRILCRRECRYCEDYDGDLLGYEEVVEEDDLELISDDKEGNDEQH